MFSYQGYQGPWWSDAGWVERHTSVSSKEHGAFAQVVSEMEDFTSKTERNKLDATLELIVNAPEMLSTLMHIYDSGLLPPSHQALVENTLRKVTKEYPDD